MESSDLCSRVLLKERIKLEPKYLTQSYKEEVLNRLKQKVEGICTKHGYIRKNSIELYKVVPGVVEVTSLNGNVIFEVAFHADVCNPLVGTIIKSAKVVNLNRFGILAEARMTEDKFATSVLEIIIAKNSVNIVSEVDLESINIGDDINVEVVGKKIKIGDRKISVIGKVVKDAKRKEPRYKSAITSELAEAEEEDEEDVADADAIEEEEDEEEDEQEEEQEDETKEDEEDEDDDKLEGGSEFFSDNEFDEEDGLSSGHAEEDDDIYI